MLIKGCIANVVVVYIGILILVYVNKPKIMFKEDGEIKNHGLGHDKTLFSFPVFCITLAILVFFVMTSITELLSKIKITVIED